MQDRKDILDATTGDNGSGFSVLSASIEGIENAESNAETNANGRADSVEMVESNDGSNIDAPSRDPADYLHLARRAANAFCRRRHWHHDHDPEEVYAQAALEMCLALTKYDESRNSNIELYIRQTVYNRLTDWIRARNGTPTRGRRRHQAVAGMLRIDASPTVARQLVDLGGVDRERIASGDFLAWVREVAGENWPAVATIFGEVEPEAAAATLGLCEAAMYARRNKVLTRLRGRWESIKDNF